MEQENKQTNNPAIFREIINNKLNEAIQKAFPSFKEISVDDDIIPVLRTYEFFEQSDARYAEFFNSLSNENNPIVATTVATVMRHLKEKFNAIENPTVFCKKIDVYFDIRHDLRDAQQASVQYTLGVA